MQADGSDVESFQSESEDEEQLSEQKERKLQINTKALEQRLGEIMYNGEWIERLDVICNADDLDMPKMEDEHTTKSQSSGLQAKGTIHDDFKRELHFYYQAQAAAKQAIEKLSHLGLPTERPDDYFAEMIKTDAHMHKVRQKLANEKQARENAEKVKKMRRMKKFGKKVQQEVLQKRQEEKKRMLQAVDRIKKGKDKLKDTGNDLFDIKTDNKNEKPKFQKSMKRKRKDDKYGFGGKKKKAKKNTASTSSDMSGFKSAIHSKAPRHKAKVGKGKPKRLGKSRRQKAKSKK